MKRFHFHLQRVLDLKEKEKEQAEWALGQSVRRKNEEEWKLVQLTEHLEEMTNKLHSMQSEPCSASQLKEITRYRQSVQRSIASQLHTLQGCQQEVDRCQHRLVERTQESRLWQRLREKAFEHFSESEKQREQKELDEIGTQLYLRQCY